MDCFRRSIQDSLNLDTAGVCHRAGKQAAEILTFADLHYGGRNLSCEKLRTSPFQSATVRQRLY